MIEGEVKESPSVQMRISPLGVVQILSTHDQMLGGPSGQSYLGAVFPADPAYSRLITSDAAKIGDRFVRTRNVRRFALDFLVVKRDDGQWQPFAIEVNLRKGGTTHPFLTLQFDGHSNDAGMMTRCEAYLDSKGILRWWRKQQDQPTEGASKDGPSSAHKWPTPVPDSWPPVSVPSGSKRSPLQTPIPKR